MSRNYNREFQEGLWDHFNPGGDGAINFDVLTEEFLREGLQKPGEKLTENLLDSGGILSIIACFAINSDCIKFDSRYDEGDPRRTENLEGKVLGAMRDAVKVLRDLDPFMLDEAHRIFNLFDNTPAPIKALFEELGLRTDEVTASAGVAAATSAEDYDAFTAHEDVHLGGSAGTDHTDADASGWGPAAGQR